MRRTSESAWAAWALKRWATDWTPPPDTSPLISPAGAKWSRQQRFRRNELSPVEQSPCAELCLSGVRFRAGAQFAARTAGALLGAHRRNGCRAQGVRSPHPQTRSAADASEEHYRHGRSLSPVDGGPIGIKDIMATADMATEMGSPAFAGHQRGYDAACVQALRAGGAIVVGQTATTAFACGGPAATTNPFDAARTPGGSSRVVPWGSNRHTACSVCRGYIVYPTPMTTSVFWPVRWTMPGASPLISRGGRAARNSPFWTVRQLTCPPRGRPAS